jgi:hypothetical protein
VDDKCCRCCIAQRDVLCIVIIEQTVWNNATEKRISVGVMATVSSACATRIRSPIDTVDALHCPRLYHLGTTTMGHEPTRELVRCLIHSAINKSEFIVLLFACVSSFIWNEIYSILLGAPSQHFAGQATPECNGIDRMFAGEDVEVQVDNTALPPST